MEVNPNPFRRLADSTFVKLSVLGFLFLLLLIPMSQVSALITERHTRHFVVQHEVAATWGGAQTLQGPVIAVPYRSFERCPESQNLRQSELATLPCAVLTHAVFLPKEVAWEGRIEPQVRYRGIFEVVVYEVHLRAEGFFQRPVMTPFAAAKRVRWNEAALAVSIPDLRGLQSRPQLVWNGEEHAFLPGSRLVESLASGLHVPLPDLAATAAGEPIPFSFEMVLRGAETLDFLPLGEETRVTLSSPWPAPGFSGAFLPQEREIGEAGFTARWQVPYFGRGYPQAWRASDVATEVLSDSAFGVTLVRPADGYQQTERAVKYAVLFILLTFSTFFLLELISPVRLHPLQYLLVGFALCLFYLLLLAVSEHTGFGPAYLLATLSIAGLVSAYAGSILGRKRWAALLALCLGGLYGFLYVLLRAEDYALLMGTVGLFLLLALFMYLTRHLDWYRLRFAPNSATGEAV